jgi:hypothetical protein
VFRVAVTALLGLLLTGCGTGASASEPVLCEVAHGLTVAVATTEQAAAEDAAGDKVGAQQLAGEARSRAQKAHDQLQTINSDEVRQGATWQALLESYLYVGQAANALLPGFESTYGMTDEQLTLARPQLETAASALPAECTTVNESPGVAPA